MSSHASSGGIIQSAVSMEDGDKDNDDREVEMEVRAVLGVVAVDEYL